MYNLLISKSFTFEMCFQLYILFHNNNFYHYFDINTLTVNIQNFANLMMSIDTKTLNRKKASF
jgi:hypothetical protein